MDNPVGQSLLCRKTVARPKLPFQLPESSSAAVSIAVVLISSGAPEEINLGTGKQLFHYLRRPLSRLGDH